MRGMKNNGRSKKSGQYVGLGKMLVTSMAFRSLGGNALKFYIELRMNYNGTNNGKIHLSYEEAAKRLKIGKATVARAIDELIEKGLLKLRSKGDFSSKQASEFVLTDRTYNNKPPTHEWQRWPHEVQEVPPKNQNYWSAKKQNSVLKRNEHGSETERETPKLKLVRSE